MGCDMVDRGEADRERCWRGGVGVEEKNGCKKRSSCSFSYMNKETAHV
jgi:hypothetical protein